VKGSGTRVEREPVIAVLLHEVIAIRGRIPRYVRDALADICAEMPVADEQMSSNAARTEDLLRT
jgi:hypothetical protein